MIYVLGVDPGKHTGLCLLTYDISNDEINYMCHNTINDINITVLMDWIEEKIPAIAMTNTVVCVENMVMTGSITQGKVAQIQAMTVVKEVCRVQELIHKLMSPETRRKINRELKQIPHVIKNDHSQDAFRIAKAYILLNKSSWLS